MLSVCTAAVALLALISLPAQNLSVTPSSATLLVGQSQPFRLADKEGRKQHNVVWEILPGNGAELQQGDEVTMSANHPGKLYSHGIARRRMGGSQDPSIGRLGLPHGHNQVVEPDPVWMSRTRNQTGSTGCERTGYL